MGHDTNPMAFLTKELCNIGNSGSRLLVADTNSTATLASILVQMYNLYTPLLEKASNATQQAATKNDNNSVTADSQYFTLLTNLSNTSTGQGQSAVSVQQNQASQDGTNCAKFIQFASSVIQILHTNAQLLSN